MYFHVCIAQSVWTFVFGYEIMWLSAVVMFCILAPLIKIVLQQTEIDVSIGFFWLFKFPVSLFYFHSIYLSESFIVL